MCAWYLHSIASSKVGKEIYGIERQRAAFEVSAQIFDLLIQASNQDDIQKMQFCFAAQIAYLRSELIPNSIALYNDQVFLENRTTNFIDSYREIALSSAIKLLGFDVDFVITTANDLYKQIESLASNWGIESVFLTPFGAAAGVVMAARDIMIYLLSGKTENLEQARKTLVNSIESQASVDDIDSRWVAAHLLNILSDIKNSSIWEVLPPDVSPNIKRAFALGKPHVLTLWPPQIDLITSGENPFDPSIKRLFISAPTSGGKSLFAQLLITVHLAKESTSVCYIAPTRSLCREIKSSLESRFRFYGKPIFEKVSEEVPSDFFSLLDDELVVEVMTPERLSSLLHSDSKKFLEKFGLFIFDEIHLVGEMGRGWTLEQDIAYIQYATRGLKHKIVAITAAIGNKIHFVEWLQNNGNSIKKFDSEWRGPRRINAICSSEVDWRSIEITRIRRPRKNTHREFFDLYSRLDIHIANSNKIQHLKTVAPVGKLVCDVDRAGNKTKNSSLSTPFYKTLVPIIHNLGLSGNVLVITPTRDDTVRLALAVAEALDDVADSDILQLLNLVEIRFGKSYPLYTVLQKRVAFHNASLPHDIRALIEDEVRNQNIKYLVATTTMTEGVNLPVRSVVISSLGIYVGNDFREIITGSKLINAIGRAGRATKETEGIVVLANPSPPSIRDFSILSPNIEEIKVLSNLANELALKELAKFEETILENQDEIFNTDIKTIQDFIKFIWFVAAELERIDKTLKQDDVSSLLDNTLAWRQLKKDEQERWANVASKVVETYDKTNSRICCRWATSDTSINSSRTIDQIAQEVAIKLAELKPGDNFDKELNTLIEDDRLERLLHLDCAPRFLVYNKRSRRNQDIVNVQLFSLIKKWVDGADTKSLADEFLNEVEDINYRYEQIGELIYNYFEIYLSWITRIVITWSNQYLEELGSEERINPSIASFIKWGVNSKVAVELMTAGIQSRSLANTIAKEWELVAYKGTILPWIRSMDILTWKKAFNATILELKSLIKFAKEQSHNIIARVIADRSADIQFRVDIEDCDQTEVFLRPISDNEVTPIGIWVEESLQSTVPSVYHEDVQTLLELGALFHYKFQAKSGIGKLTVTLIDSV